MDRKTPSVAATKQTNMNDSNPFDVVAPIEKRNADDPTANTPELSGKRDALDGKQKTRAQSRPAAGADANCADMYDELFDQWDADEFVPEESMVEIPVDCLESIVGYSSLFRQMQHSFLRTVAFHKSDGGGAISDEEARAKAFHPCTDEVAAKKRFTTLMRIPLDLIHFVDLLELHLIAPRVAERLWELIKREGQKEFTSGHLSANITFPVGYMKEVWNIARYQGVRSTFIAEWVPKGGIELSLIDIMTQSYFQWQYWVEQTVKRSQTEVRREHPEYTEWMNRREREFRRQGWTDGHWSQPYVSEQEAIEHAVQMADRWNRIYMRTLRQLRDLRRYTPVSITNVSQVNIAAAGGKQINVTDK
jgi:hypothetical protein